MVDDNPAQTVSVACLHIKILEEQVHPPLPVQLQQLKFWYNSFLLSSCAVKVQCTHYWEKASQPAWSACWALQCIWSPQGCPWKTQLCWIHCEHQTEECQTQPDLQRALFLACHLKKKRRTSICMIKCHLPLPHTKTLVIWCTDKSPIFIHEGDGVDGSQVTVILLHHLACPNVPLEEKKSWIKKSVVKNS